MPMFSRGKNEGFFGVRKALGADEENSDGAQSAGSGSPDRFTPLAHPDEFRPSAPSAPGEQAPSDSASSADEVSDVTASDDSTVSGESTDQGAVSDLSGTSSDAATTSEETPSETDDKSQTFSSAATAFSALADKKSEKSDSSADDDAPKKRSVSSIFGSSETSGDDADSTEPTAGDSASLTESDETVTDASGDVTESTSSESVESDDDGEIFGSEFDSFVGVSGSHPSTTPGADGDNPFSDDEIVAAEEPESTEGDASYAPEETEEVKESEVTKSSKRSAPTLVTFIGDGKAHVKSSLSTMMKDALVYLVDMTESKSGNEYVPAGAVRSFVPVSSSSGDDYDVMDMMGLIRSSDDRKSYLVLTGADEIVDKVYGAFEPGSVGVSVIADKVSGIIDEAYDNGVTVVVVAQKSSDNLLDMLSLINAGER